MNMEIGRGQNRNQAPSVLAEGRPEVQLEETDCPSSTPTVSVVQGTDRHLADPKVEGWSKLKKRSSFGEEEFESKGNKV